MKSQADYEIEYATRSGHDALANARATLANARATLERALAELDHYIARYEGAEDIKDKANVLNWALGHLATYVPSNVRLDMIATAQAELMRVRAAQ
ncbi:TPA: hypothetical protein ACPWIL_002357 [Pseudomonas aeruginosa]|uniref:hypothetical protein n=1 Tax=Pseudomonas aeruginosa group TaxID=136841 RepID=UPI00066643E8|nr:hypothetical protein [Pseudomonas aeruginosa]MBI7315487.1 hypothetical protein [Pseudomonas aeruginosa]MBI7327791.1 hypothetical protein [Pseudomonas aeruginosa]MBI7496164.1 hypothetical protein [Pseudomonas aeruginosa]MCW8022914.1 hypothetical protein [Pseudomonas aeruginosa]MDI3657111.1 hypothetical protein [Pseudomonas aeruginosa]